MWRAKWGGADSWNTSASGSHPPRRRGVEEGISVHPFVNLLAASLPIGTEDGSNNQ